MNNTVPSRDKTTIWPSVGELEEKLIMLEQEVTMLADSLTPLIPPAEPESVKPSSAVRTASSPFAVRLSVMVAQADRIRDFVSSLARRLEV